MAEQQTPVVPRRTEIHYGSTRIQVSPEEADRVEEILRTDWSATGTDLPSTELLTVEEVHGNEYALWLSPGVPIAIYRPSNEHKLRK